MNTRARPATSVDEFDTIALAIARALARQHHAEALADRASTNQQENHAHRNLRPLLDSPPKR